MITVKQAQEMICCSETTIYKLIHRDGFPKLEKNNLKSYGIDKSKFIKWCQENGYEIKGNGDENENDQER